MCGPGELHYWAQLHPVHELFGVPFPAVMPRDAATLCEPSAVRDAADRGFLVTVPADACATKSAEEETASLAVMKGYARIAETAELLDEMGARGATAA